MKTKTILILVLVVAMAGAGAWWMASHRAPSVPVATDTGNVNPVVPMVWMDQMRPSGDVQATGVQAGGT